MPIYEYQCNGCNHTFDFIQKINDSTLLTCPNCSEDKLVRLVSAPGFQLKGTGWYETDFKSPQKPTATTADNATATKDTTSAPSDCATCKKAPDTTFS